MPSEFIEYRSGYKYQLASDFNIQISIKPDDDIDNQFIALDKLGNLRVKSGYAWDGTSGPVVDTNRNLRASLVHDALYQLMRKKAISAAKFKDKADRLFKKLCKEDGVSPAIAQVYYEALKALGRPATDPKNAKEIKRAPNMQ
ncbi:MAG: DUF1353 domain-containing protein [Cyclobacteriaceae bacterium]|nr:DUF1353 domain-containing protein [Cyclobacteriaceae bacterium]